ADGRRTTELTRQTQDPWIAPALRAAPGRNRAPLPAGPHATLDRPAAVAFRRPWSPDGHPGRRHGVRILMGFNNQPETRFQDIKGVLRLARERVEKRLR